MQQTAPSAVPATVSATVGPGPCLVLTCEVMADGGLRISAYDAEAGQAFRALLRRSTDGSWFVDGRPRMVGNGGASDRTVVEDRGASALVAWAKAHEGVADAVRDLAIREARERPRSADESRQKRARWLRRQAEVQDRLAQSLASALRERVSRTLEGFPMRFEMTHRGTRHAVSVEDGEPLLRIEGGPEGTVAIRWDGTSEVRGESVLPSKSARSLALQAARRRGDPLVPMARLLKARWDALAHRAEADRLDGTQAQASVPDRAGVIPVEPAPDRFAWRGVSHLTGERLQVCLHDLHGARQVHALVEPVDGTWIAHEAMSSLSFRTGRREELNDAEVARFASAVAASHAGAGRPMALADHGEGPDAGPFEGPLDGDQDVAAAPHHIDAPSVDAPHGTSDRTPDLDREADEAVGAGMEPEPPAPGAPSTSDDAPSPEANAGEPEAEEPAATPTGTDAEPAGEPAGPGPDAVEPTPAEAPADPLPPEPFPSPAHAEAVPLRPGVRQAPPDAAEEAGPAGPGAQETVAAAWDILGTGGDGESGPAGFDPDDLDPEDDGFADGGLDGAAYDPALDDDREEPSEEDLAALADLFPRPAPPVPDGADRKERDRVSFFRNVVAVSDRLRDSGVPYPHFPFNETFEAPNSRMPLTVTVVLDGPGAITIMRKDHIEFEGNNVKPGVRYTLRGEVAYPNPVLARMLAAGPGWELWAKGFKNEADTLARTLVEGNLGIAIRGERAKIALGLIRRERAMA
jgi:hypothetical protein